MATLKILRCKNCTAPLPAGTTTCPKCHAVNLVQSEVNPLRLPSNLTNDYIEFFKQQTEANPKDTNALFGMGLVYMGLKNYELAQRNFKLAVDQSPLDADIYYYFALSLFSLHAFAYWFMASRLLRRQLRLYSRTDRRFFSRHLRIYSRRSFFASSVKIIIPF